MSRDKLARVGRYDGHNRKAQKTPMRVLRWRANRRRSNRVLKETAG